MAAPYDPKTTTGDETPAQLFIAYFPEFQREPSRNNFMQIAFKNLKTVENKFPSRDEEKIRRKVTSTDINLPFKEQPFYLVIKEKMELGQVVDAYDAETLRLLFPEGRYHEWLREEFTAKGWNPDRVHTGLDSIERQLLPGARRNVATASSTASSNSKQQSSKTNKSHQNTSLTDITNRHGRALGATPGLPSSTGIPKAGFFDIRHLQTPTPITGLFATLSAGTSATLRGVSSTTNATPRAGGDSDDETTVGDEDDDVGLVNDISQLGGRPSQQPASGNDGSGASQANTPQQERQANPNRGTKRSSLARDTGSEIDGYTSVSEEGSRPSKRQRSEGSQHSGDSGGSGLRLPFPHAFLPHDQRIMDWVEDQVGLLADQIANAQVQTLGQVDSQIKAMVGYFGGRIKDLLDHSNAQFQEKLNTRLQELAAQLDHQMSTRLQGVEDALKATSSSANARLTEIAARFEPLNDSMDSFGDRLRGVDDRCREVLAQVNDSATDIINAVRDLGAALRAEMNARVSQAEAHLTAAQNQFADEIRAHVDDQIQQLKDLIDTQVKQLNARIDSQVKQLNARIDDQRKLFNSRMNQMEDTVSQVLKTVREDAAADREQAAADRAALNERMDRHEDAINERMDRHEAAVNERLDGIEARIIGVEQETASIKKAMQGDLASYEDLVGLRADVAILRADINRRRQEPDRT